MFRAIVYLLIAVSGLAAAAPHPNIVLFMADDMGLGDTSAYQDFTGNPDDKQYLTPNMERLANMGVRFTDAHAPSSRCSPTRYSLLTGRYAWRNRLKHWVLFGAQGDPMIEADRPTIASMLRDQGYRTAMVGKWHVGLRYTRSDGKPAAGWDDADLTKPLHTSPVDHGFDYARFTSRSHGTSGPNSKSSNKAKRNSPTQSSGPGHLHGRTAVGATGDGKEIVARGPNAYVLNKLGSRHSDHALEFLNAHVEKGESKTEPFFLYYPSNSNHSPYTPDEEIGGIDVAGTSADDARREFVYENDVALGRLMKWLSDTDDPRVPGEKLIHNTLVIFTSDNGAEVKSKTATGPFRSNKGSVYEGGHRVPFIAAWPAGSVEGGTTSPTPIGLQDMFATFAEITGAPLPNLRAGAKGAEDSFSILPVLRGALLPNRPPIFFNDHSQAKPDPAVAAMRLDNPIVAGKPLPGHWKVFFAPRLLRAGEAQAIELYNLEADPRETMNRIGEEKLAPLIKKLSDIAALHRNTGGHRLAPLGAEKRIRFDWRNDNGLIEQISGKTKAVVTVAGLLTMTASTAPDGTFSTNERGLGIGGGDVKQVDAGEAITIRFDRDVLVESAAIVAGNGTCGGFYKVGDAAPLAIYCTDADIDEKDQSGILSDIGVLKAGDVLRLDSSPHYGVEAAGRWRLASLIVRPLRG